MAAPICGDVQYDGLSNGATANPAVVTKPTGTVEGDLLIALVGAGNAASRYCLTPSGWTLLVTITGTVTGAAQNAHAFYKIAGASEPSTYDFTPASNYCTISACIVRITGAEDPATTSIVIATDFPGGSSGTEDSPTITPTNADSLVLRFACTTRATGAAAFSFASSTEILDVSPAGTLGVASFESGASATGAETITYVPTWWGSSAFCHIVLAIAPPAPPAGPTGIGGEIGWYCPSLDDSANDLSGNANHGTYNGGMGTVSDVSNGGTLAYSTDGIDDEVSLPTALIPNAYPFCISAWIKPFDATGNMMISMTKAGQDNVYWISGWHTNETGRAIERYATTGFAESLVVGTGWHHIVSIFRSKTDRGVIVDNATEVVDTTDSTLPIGSHLMNVISIGSLPRLSAVYYKGYCDDVRIFHRELSAAEITELASARGYQRSTNILPICVSRISNQMRLGW